VFSKKSLFLFIIYFLAIIGFLSIILFIIGYRPVNTETSPDWEAISSIATIFAVIIALFITKWQDILNNKKVIKLEWLNVENNGDFRFYYQDFTKERRLDEICIKFVNTGNRNVILKGFYIEFPNKEKSTILPEAINIKNKTNEISFPCKLEPEMVSQIHIPFMEILFGFKKFIEDRKINESNHIVIVAYDTTNKTYSLNTRITYKTYFIYSELKHGNFEKLMYLPNEKLFN